MSPSIKSLAVCTQKYYQIYNDLWTYVLKCSSAAKPTYVTAITAFTTGLKRKPVKFWPADVATEAWLFPRIQRQVKLSDAD